MHNHLYENELSCMSMKSSFRREANSNSEMTHSDGKLSLINSLWKNHFLHVHLIRVNHRFFEQTSIKFLLLFGVESFSLSQWNVALVDCGRIIKCNSFPVGTEFAFTSTSSNLCKKQSTLT